MVTLALLKQMLRSKRWEDRFGAINGTLALIQTRASDAQSSATALDAFLWTELLDKFFIEMIEDEEFRVRNQSALLIKAIIGSDCTGKGIANFDKVKNLILANI